MSPVRRRTASRRVLFALLTIATIGIQAPTTGAQTAALSDQEAQSIATDAYVYFYPLVTMDVTRKQFTNIEPGKELGKGPMNMFNNVPEYPPANFKGVVRPNFDTLYSISYLDLTKEPMVVSVPDTGGRYYLLPMIDMWSDVFASPGWRTTGTQAGNFLVAPVGWRPDLRERLVEEFRLPKDIERITPRRRTCGSSVGPRPMDHPTMLPSTKSRPTSKSRHCLSGVGHPNHRRCGVGAQCRHEDTAQIAGR